MTAGRLSIGLALLAGCSQLGTTELVVQQVTPPMGPPDKDVMVTIEGAGFRLPITSSLDEETTTVGTVGVEIGGDLANQRQSDTLIEALIPAGLPPGPHDVTVTIGNQSDTLVGGYTVIAPLDPLHLPPGAGIPGTDPLVLTGNVGIDTSIPLMTIPLPPGVTFDVADQIGGSEVAVLHVSTLTVESGAMVSIIGTRPLIVVASGDIRVDGVLDAGGHGPLPGPGGALPGEGMQAGGAAGHEFSAESDSGGGGGGYGTGGAAGGPIDSGGCTVAGGLGGGIYGDPAISLLVGGSGGAFSSGLSCVPDPGGAGGGAIQLSSQSRIALGTGGAINAGGGGGRGSTDCGQSDVNSGAGGGSGGSIVLQAPAISNAGIIAANGGAGGGSSQTGAGSVGVGQDGRIGSEPAIGSTGPRTTGGSGGTGNLAPTVGGNMFCGANAGGGGGGVGRIAVSSGFVDTGTVSPAPDTSLPP